ncbi:MAG: hypothetical protein U5L96_12680 [Owenweeksia sp.]|nr:hypothetical protein [Owenweeksia sp.]
MKAQNTILKSLIFFIATLFIGWNIEFLKSIHLENLSFENFEVGILWQYVQMIIFMILVGSVFCMPLLVLIVPYFWLTALKGGKLSHWQHIVLNVLFGLMLSWSWAWVLQSWDDAFSELQAFIPGAMLAGIFIELIFPASFKNKPSSYFTGYFISDTLQNKRP